MTKAATRVRSAGAVAAAVAALAGLGVAVLAPPGPHLPGTNRGGMVIWLTVAWCAFAVGAWLVARLPRRVAVVLIITGGLVLPVLAGLTAARSSDDVYRYRWDARVQSAGVNPYQHPPAARELVGLRDDFLWPPDGAWCVTPEHVDGGTDGAARVVRADEPAAGAREVLVEGCSRINRPGVHTIYPPMAQELFAVVGALSPAGAGIRGFQVLAIVAALVTTVLLVIGLRRAGADPRRAVLWAWCPTVAVEAGGNAHIDVVAAGLVVAALLFLAGGTRAGTTVGGVLIGLAIAVKVTPVLLVPAVVRRRPVTVVLAVLGALGVVYLPHLWAVGGEVIGYLPGYLRDEGYADGSRYALVSWLVPAGWSAPVAVAGLAAVGLAVAANRWRDRPGAGTTEGAAVMVGVALVLSTPAYPWYALLLVAMVAGGAPAIWLAVAAAGYIAQYAAGLSIPLTAANRLGYGLAVAAVGLTWSTRWMHRRWTRRGSATTTRDRHGDITHTRTSAVVPEL